MQQPRSSSQKPSKRSGPSRAVAGETSTHAETAQYIAEMVGELGELARGSKLDMVAYLLDMVKLEASRCADNQTTR